MPKKRASPKEGFDNPWTPNKRCQLKEVFDGEDQVSPVDFEDKGLENLKFDIQGRQVDTEESKGEEGELSYKTVKLDDAKIPVHLWNDITAQK